MSQNENEGAVVIHTAKPDSQEDRKIRMSLEVSENLLRRRLEEDKKSLDTAGREADSKCREARKELLDYAEAYAKKELMDSGPLEELLNAVNALLLPEEQFDLDDFIGDVVVGHGYYASSHSNASELLDDDGLLIIRFACVVEIFDKLVDGSTLCPTYRVSIDSDLSDLNKKYVELQEKCSEINDQLREVKEKLENVGKTITDVKTDLLIKQLKEMDGGDETFTGVTAILSSYLNGEQPPNLLLPEGEDKDG